MALGAFLAGMMLAETEYRHQVESAVRPFRELLLGLFFISVGMLLDCAPAVPALPAGIRAAVLDCCWSRACWWPW